MKKFKKHIIQISKRIKRFTKGIFQPIWRAIKWIARKLKALLLWLLEVFLFVFFILLLIYTVAYIISVIHIVGYVIAYIVIVFLITFVIKRIIDSSKIKRFITLVVKSMSLFIFEFIFYYFRAYGCT